MANRQASFRDTLARIQDLVAEETGARLGAGAQARLEAILRMAPDEPADSHSDPFTSRDVTILLADLRGFSSISEGQSSDTILELLRPYFATMTETVLRYMGEDEGQQLLAFVEKDRKAGKGIAGYEYAVLVTNTDYEILTLGQLYRDRADAENGFDELKNQWGWGGFTTHDLHRCQLAARAVALIYNWWSLFVRLANPEARREAITSRPWLMSSVGRRTEHAGQTTITH